MNRRARRRYIDHVVAVLADEFGWDDTTRDICRAEVGHNEYANGYPPWFEFICDWPYAAAANWRLKSDPQDRRRLRLSYYGGPSSDRAQTRADEVTQRLNDPSRPREQT